MGAGLKLDGSRRESTSKRERVWAIQVSSPLEQVLLVAGGGNADDQETLHGDCVSIPYASTSSADIL